MGYVIDTNALIHLFDNFYLSRFPSMWSLFDEMVDSGRLLSVREALHEIASYQGTSRLLDWADQHQWVFEQPTAEESEFVGRIFAVRHFQQLINKKKMLSGGYVADPFVVAKAKVQDRVVLTREKFKANAAKIPNVCEHFGVPCVGIEEFMVRENWVF